LLLARAQSATPTIELAAPRTLDKDTVRPSALAGVMRERAGDKVKVAGYAVAAGSTTDMGQKLVTWDDFTRPVRLRTELVPALVTVHIYRLYDSPDHSGPGIEVRSERKLGAGWQSVKGRVRGGAGSYYIER
jgi:hypothetical protein